MTDARNIGQVLVIGGGYSGMGAAIELRKRGIEVDLLEIDPGWRSDGTGISISPATLRALGTIGALDEYLRCGYAADGCTLMTPADTVIGVMPTQRLAGAEVPGAGAIMRPVLARILAEATRAAGTCVMLGRTYSAITQDADGVDVTFSDGEQRRYDLVVGADGLASKLRQQFLPGAGSPRHNGQAVWRAVLPRPRHIDRTHVWLGVPGIKPGVNPVSQDELYMFITVDEPKRERVDPATFVDRMAALLAPFPSPLLQAMRAQLGDSSLIVYRPLEQLLVPRPWCSGRVVLIGDAVHATTPQLASGACIGIEDGIVLAEELSRGGAVSDALQRFQDRRWERCRMVVENSARLGELEVAGGSREEQQRLMQQSLASLALPI